ncbi:hypothetical protein CHGG_06656 [Chaetomium globosum CBS 148.51]|uniref:5'-3' DNA helicase ZGRF1-like N-terminal domain-containing protein n=1 Tax=Chaetomium globosum (strain ATCC 6205 / CBS 148.51 / DSM 1962 / NBRC 6347 / NRRL 1970) TaxID=306901 RepID=Q2H3V9_CHAGB|nr:uncharacterized protein CHGG_06656 [Chaetomium globosum CBS 148.51]EAQ90037.1 hypothetical protein CHGG_06656 [Chaetomium globosum CBS 148.51]
MVYDERGNFVGDLHWQREKDFDEGEEVQLERGGVIVQVMECVGRQEQDLSELLDKRAKEKEQRQARVRTRPAPATAAPNTPLAAPRAQDHFQTRHRPLNHVLGTPTGHHGRALVPHESPFELRQKANDNSNGCTEPRPSKRRRRDVTPPSKMGYAQSLFGATLSLSAVPVSSAPPRRPANSVSRPQSVTSSQEVGQDLRHVQEGRDRSDGADSRACSVMEKQLVPPPRSLYDDDRSAVDEHNVKTGFMSTDLGPPRPVGTTQNCHQSTTLQPTDANSRLSTSFGNGKPPAILNGQTMNPRRSDKPETKRNPQPTSVTDQTETVTSNCATVVSGLGSSRSQAIVLNEDPHSGAGAEAPSFQRQERPGSVAEPQYSLPRNSTRLSKRNKSLQSTARPQPVESGAVVAEDEAEDRSPSEERTELRLKPRQKRGLLLLSEKRDRPKQNKRQSTSASGPSLTDKPLQPPTISAAIGPSLTACLGTTDIASIAQHGNTFSPLPVAPEILTLEPDPPQPLSQGHQDIPLEDDTGCQTTDSTSCIADGDSIGRAAKPVDPPNLDQSDSPKRDHNNMLSIYDRTGNLSPSPPNRKLASRGEGRVHPHNEPNRSLEFEPEQPPTNLPQEPAILGSPRRTRKASPDDQGSGRLKKKARKEDSAGTGGEEVPRPPVKPRLAKLSRKSIRSREVFGFVPSSPPLSNLANPFRPTVIPETFDSAANESTGSHGLIAPVSRVFPVPDETPLSARDTTEAQTSLPRKVLPRAISPILPLCDTIPGTGSGEGVVEGPGNTTVEGCVPHPSIGAPKKEADVSTTTLGRASQEQPPDIIPLRPQLHENLLGPSEQPEWPMGDISSIRIGSGVTESTAEHILDAQAVGPTRRRIANPATRGRKAALKSDAAGRVPQSILPVEPIPALRGVRPPAMPHPEPSTSERPKRKMKFPGFASAKGGGPWSREAHDLLETTRPG